TKRELLKLAETKSQEEAVRKLSHHYDLTGAFELYKKDGSLVHFETALENLVAQKGVKALRRSMLSVGAIVGYIYLKNAEVGNIRKIVSAIEFGIPEEKLKEMLVIAG
ncbi:MAG: V-type ATPase subunit, partial [Candidatus Micrarchaeota archaeon]